MQKKIKNCNFFDLFKFSNHKKISCILYKIMFNLSIIDNVWFKWLNFIKSIFEWLCLIIYGTNNGKFIQCN